MAELEDYRKAVEEYAQNRTDHVFQNQGDEHALIVLSTMFKNANSYIRMAAGSLSNKEVVGAKEYTDNLLGFVNKPNTKLDIIVTKYNGEDLPLFNLLKCTCAYKDGRVRIKNAEGKSFHDKEHNIVHFCAADSCMYRYEVDTERRSATCNMGGKEFACVLDQAFDNVFPTLTMAI